MINRATQPELEAIAVRRLLRRFEGEREKSVHLHLLDAEEAIYVRVALRRLAEHLLGTEEYKSARPGEDATTE